jgi:hypothetical protein
VIKPVVTKMATMDKVIYIKLFNLRFFKMFYN